MMRRKFGPMIRLFSYVIFIAVLTACATYNPSHDIVLTKTLASSTFTNVNSTEKNTAVPTSTLELKPTWTFLPLLPPQNSALKVRNLLDTNGNCELPCWWGIVPGQTRWQNVRDFLFPMADHVDSDNVSARGEEYIHLFFNTTYPKNDLSVFQQQYSVQNGIVEEIQINTTYLSHYSRPIDILNSVGKPQEIYIGGTIEPIMNSQAFFIALYYPNRGILSVFETGLQDMQYASTIKVCFSKIFYSEIYLWSPNKSFENQIVKILDGISKNHHSLESVTSLTVDDFFNLFTDTSLAPCFNTPTDDWIDK